MKVGVPEALREGERPREPPAAASPREGERPREPPTAASPREGERPREPPFPTRRHPSTNSVHTIGFRSTILFVTVCTEGRMQILANRDMASLIVSAWADADKWIVGQYVIMPDHVHFFCSPATCPPYDFHKWIRYWKRLTTQAAARMCAARGDARPPACAARGDARPPRLWQSGCWDTQIRTGSQYEEKWEYVRNNPVRKGIVATPADWPYQGRMNVLEWNEEA